MKLHLVLRDLITVVGAGLIVYAAACAWRPAGFGVAGLLLLGGVYLHDLGGDG